MSAKEVLCHLNMRCRVPVLQRQRIILTDSYEGRYPLAAKLLTWAAVQVQAPEYVMAADAVAVQAAECVMAAVVVWGVVPAAAWEEVPVAAWGVAAGREAVRENNNLPEISN